MFHKSKKISNLLLLLSAYIPLYFVIVVQNSFSLWENIKPENIDGKISIWINESPIEIIKAIFLYPETWIILIALGLILILIFTLYLMLYVTQLSNESMNYEITIVDVVDKNHEYLTSYIAVYILPFITLNLTTWSGITQFIVLFIFIGYIYMKYEMVYINPTLNIFFKINTYNIKYKEGITEKEYDAILLSEKEINQLIPKKIKVRGSKVLVEIKKDNKN